jgi:hypothetical protein
MRSSTIDRFFSKSAKEEMLEDAARIRDSSEIFKQYIFMILNSFSLLQWKHYAEQKFLKLFRN